MIHAVVSIIAVVCYLAAAAYQGRHLLSRDHPQPPRRRFLALGIIAVFAHGLGAFGTIYTEQGIDLGFYHVLSLIFWFVCLIGLLSNTRRPLESALALLFPLAAISIVLAYALASTNPRLLTVEPGVFAHIVLSILAYSVLSLSALQAVMLAVQERELKHRRTSGILNALPPLQTMEQILFELLWIGLVLLSLSIVAGAIYIENLFAQHLVHKTVFTILAWCVFATLLWGHRQLGWRGHTAVRCTLAGFALLFIAYFGTKVVLELILHRA